MSAVSQVLDRLQRVRQVKPNSWSAACPCCESRKGRPIAVTETNDGRVLLHAFCGCETLDVLGRLGLELQDLFDQPLTAAIRPTRDKLSASEVLAALSTEANVLAIIASDILERSDFKLQIDAIDWQRLATAAQRINHARDYIHERAK